ncbi:unnamed protein product [Brassicogethes aeneus]|uniref:Nucleoside phosphorylase domain-containing protein n=1 Tax=Brassicogethes aeneus TaxID=1431903 RepID=A0A9P0FEY6_BRAAE|nr:unnamed protein product [Brassicogethes aeneus]
MFTNGNPKNEESEESKLDTRYSDGAVRLRNPHIELMGQDILYHLAMGTESHNLVEMFGDVKFVCMGGTPQRMENFAHYVMKEIDFNLPIGATLIDLSQYRYSMYKVGPVLSISHGMGISSIGILLHEIIKLMFHAKVKNPIFFRIGTSGGVGVKGGTVVISDTACDELLNNYYETPIVGNLVKRPAILDQSLVQELKALADPEDPYDVVTGGTMCANDFYEGQGRLDGAFCNYSEKDKMDYLKKLQNHGVKNIEMEVVPFAAMTHHAGIRAAVVCVTFLDRLKGDQVPVLRTLWRENGKKNATNQLACIWNNCLL